MRANRGKFGFSAIGLTVLALVCFTWSAFGQTATGTITGTVTDPKGLAMTGVNILIHSADTGVDMKPIMSGDAGLYVAPLLPPGNYDLTASRPGFGTVEHKGVTLEVGATVRIDFEMPVATQQSLVTVTTEVPLLETEKTEQSQSVSESEVNDLPVSSRNWQQYQMLVPGLNPDGTTGAAAYHGINSLYSTNTVDGANNNSNYSGGARGQTGPNGAGYTYSSDSIREFNIASSGFSADTGQSAGGAVNAVTKSGTSQLHGDAFFYGREPEFNALDPVGKTAAAVAGTTPTQTIHQQYQFGGSAGGPIIKDKLFFFGTYDSFREVDPNIVNAPVTSTGLAVNSPAFGCPVIPGYAAQALLTTECNNTKAYLFQHLYGDFQRQYIQGVELIKLDYQMNTTNHISAVTNWHDTVTTADPKLFNGAGPSIGQNRFVIVNLTTIIGADKVNSLVYQWGNDNAISSLQGNTGMPSVLIGGTSTTTAPVSYGQGGAGTGIGLEVRNEVSDNFSFTKGTHSFKTGVDLNFIFDNQRSATNGGGVYTYTSGPSAAVDGCGTAANGGTSDTDFCAWILDLYGVSAPGVTQGRNWTNYTQLQDNVNATYPQSFDSIFPDNDYGVFFQDSWKARPNLTINAGVRWDLQAITFLPNSISNLLKTGKLPSTDTDLPIFDTYTNVYPNEYNGFQPRLGIAYNAQKNTVIRVDAGVFFAKTEGHNVKNVISGASESTTSCTLTNSSVCANPSLDFPNLYFNQTNNQLLSLQLPGVVEPTVQGITNASGAQVPIPTPSFGIRGVSPTLRRPRVVTVSAGVEERLPGNMNLSISYILTSGSGLPMGQDFNIAPNYNPATGQYITETYSVLNSSNQTTQTFTLPLFWTRCAIPVAGQPCQETNAEGVNTDSRTGPINGNISVAKSLYQGAVVTFRIPTSHGLELLANYTYSHSTDNGEQGAGNGGNPSEGQLGIVPLDPFNRSIEEGNSGTDLRNRFTASVIYAPSWGKGSNSLLMREVAAGWSIASSITAQSGTHFTGVMVGSATQPVCYNNSNYAQVVCATAAAGTFTKYTPLDGALGGAGITSPGADDPGRFGGVAPGSNVLPDLYNVDVRVEKDWSIRERYHLEFRIEAFNLFNSTLVLAENTGQYSYAAPGSAGCPASNGTNTCLIPEKSFGTPLTTTGTLLGARQMQGGLRFEF